MKTKKIDTKRYFGYIEILNRESRRSEEYDTYVVHKGYGYADDGSEWAISWLEQSDEDKEENGVDKDFDEDVTFEDLRKRGTDAKHFMN